MGRPNGSATHCYRRCNDVLDSQKVQTPHGSYDVDNCIDRAHFMEVDLLDGATVNSSLLHGDTMEGLHGAIFDPRGKAALLDDPTDFRKSPVSVMFRLMRVFVAVVVMMSFVVLVFMVVFV